MTAILWMKDAVYTDSLVEQGGSWYNSCDKVISVNKPCMIVTSELGGEDGTEDDWVIGMTFTGAQVPAVAMMKMLFRFTKQYIESKDRILHNTMDRLKQMYCAAGLLLLHNNENNFTCFLIGVKYNYTIGYNDGLEFSIVVHQKSQVVAFGSGQTSIMELYERFPTAAEPVRLMHHAFATEGGCGGLIWKYEAVSNKVHPSGFELVRTALYGEPSQGGRDLATALVEVPVTPILVINPTSHAGKQVVRRDLKAAQKKKISTKPKSKVTSSKVNEVSLPSTQKSTRSTK